MGTKWKIQEPETVTEDTWNIDDLSSLNSKEERDAWSMPAAVLSPNATPRHGVLGWSMDAEDFRQNPEDVDLEPEFVQGDNDDWTIDPPIESEEPE